MEAARCGDYGIALANFEGLACFKFCFFADAVVAAEFIDADAVTVCNRSEGVAFFHFHLLGCLLGSGCCFALDGSGALFSHDLVGVGRVVAGVLIGRFVECIVVGVNRLVIEVEDGGGVDGVAHEASFEVEVRASAAAGVS